MRINRNRNNNNAVILAILIGLGIIIPIAWWLLSPLWTTVEVSEALPTGAAPISTQAPAAATEYQPEATSASVAAAEMSMLAHGSFYSVAHVGSGEAGIYQLTDGTQILRLTNFQVENGPDLYVYLVPIDPVPNQSGSDIAGSINLGPLKGNVGDQNYNIPAGLDLSQYKSVVIWCQAFAVPFSAAPLASQ